jgi:hypothetical protein
VRLKDELQRAEAQVARSLDIIREALRFCDETEAHRAIPEAKQEEEGELDNEVIFCARWAQCSAWGRAALCLGQAAGVAPPWGPCLAAGGEWLLGVSGSWVVGARARCEEGAYRAFGGRVGSWRWPS